jgi:DNA repair exonuclease SbcCD nuclease subunit
VKDITIAHVSDLHLGNDFLVRSALGRRWFWKTEDPRLIKGLADALRDLKPDYVVISGDIVNKSCRRSFRHAARTLGALFQRAEVRVPSAVLVVPGNHDAPIRRTRHEYFGRLKHFAIFLRDLFGESDFVSRQPRFVRVDADRRICFIGLDSTLKVGADATQKWWFQWQVAEGELGNAQREWFARKIARLAQGHPGFEHFVKVVILHHHPEDIEGTAPTERFMQLLDKADAKAAFHQAGVNVVLHGHKHRQRVTRVPLDEKSHYTVIGAGTTLCAIPGEDGGEGNSFNLVRIRPGANLLEVQRYKASQEGAFVKSGSPMQEQLFTGAAARYRVRTSDLCTRILDMDGACVDTHRRLGVVVDGPRAELPKNVFNWASASAVSEIVDFEYDAESIAAVEYEAGADAKNARQRKGAFVLKEPLRWGGDPIDLWWTFEVKRAFCMRRSDLAVYYPGESVRQEGIEAKVEHPTDLLLLQIEFPRRFWPKVAVKCVDQNGTEVALTPDAVLQPDRVSGRYTLVVRRPILLHRYGLWWDIP